MASTFIRVSIEGGDIELVQLLERSGVVQLVETKPEVVVSHVERDADSLGDLADRLSDPDRPAFVLTTDGYPVRWLEDALELGVEEVLCLPQPPEVAGMAVAKAHAARRHRNAAKAPLSHASGEARVTTVFSTKGGSGKTVIATNLAVALARQGQRTLLVDFDLHSGDCALVLGLSPRWTVLDLVQSPGHLDAEKLKGFVTRHSSGVDVLPAPTRPDEEELVSIDRLEPLLEVARASYDVVVIDTSSQFAQATLLAVDHTDTLLLVGASDVPTIKSLKIALETLELLEMKLADVRIVMNRSGAKVGLEDRDVERTLKRQITFTLPSDKAVVVSVNHGRPVVLDAPKSRVARSMVEMAASLMAGVEVRR
jgi:pilus assembly protein CpaE